MKRASTSPPQSPRQSPPQSPRSAALQQNIANLPNELKDEILKKLPIPKVAVLNQAGAHFARTQHPVKLKQLQAQRQQMITPTRPTTTKEKVAVQKLTVRIEKGKKVVARYCQRCHKPHMQCMCK